MRLGYARSVQLRGAAMMSSGKRLTATGMETFLGPRSVFANCFAPPLTVAKGLGFSREYDVRRGRRRHMLGARIAQRRQVHPRKERLTTAEQDRRDRDMHLVDEPRLEILAHRGRPAADLDIQPARVPMYQPCSSSPPTPSGSFSPWRGPAPYPSSEIAKLWTRSLDMASSAGFICVEWAVPKSTGEGCRGAPFKSVKLEHRTMVREKGGLKGGLLPTKKNASQAKRLTRICLL